MLVSYETVTDAEKAAISTVDDIIQKILNSGTDSDFILCKK